MRSVRFALTIVFLWICVCAAAAQTNPVPLIYQPLVPASVEPGHPNFTLTVHGSNFVPGAVIKINGIALRTQLANSFTLKANLPAAAVARPGTGMITVANPGSIDSNVIYFPVRQPSDTVKLILDPNVTDAGEVAVADFNGDHKSDIAVAMGLNIPSGPYINTYFGIGNGKFTVEGGPQPINLTYDGPEIVGDFNNDGKLDLAVFDTDGSPNMWYDIFLGDGAGGFTPVTPDDNVLGVAADLNRDGILDFVGIQWDGTDWTLQAWLGNGDGTFRNHYSAQLILPYDGQPAVGDFNGDGNLDIAVPSQGGVAIFLGDGDGTFRHETDFPTLYPQTRLALADLNGDERLDIVTNGVSVLMGDGLGNFTPFGGVSLPTSSGGNVVLGDWNGDGMLDLATVAAQGQQEFLDLVLGNGNGTFTTQIVTTAKTTNTRLYDLAVGDFNSDGKLDFAVSGDQAIAVLLQKSGP